MELTFDIILQNNASRKVNILKKQINRSENRDYLLFEDVVLDGYEDGEYTYAAFVNLRDDVEYEVKNELGETVVMTSEGNVLLKHLNPFYGLLKIENKDHKTLFYNPQLKDDAYTQNLTIYFYKG